MKKIYKSVFLTPFFLILSTIALAQCDFKAGDIAFTGYQIFDDNDNGSLKDDVFSFVLLRDAPAGLEIFFTDLGWTSDGKFQEKENAPSDGIIKWKTLVDIPAGTQVTITAKFNLTASIGQVTGVQNTQFGNYMDLGIAGDQLFAFTGTIMSPILLAGLNINKPAWDTGYFLSTFSSSTSVNPFLNNNAVQSISVGYQITDNRKAYNAVLKSGTYSGKVPVLISLLNNPSSWETDETIYPGTIPGYFALPSASTFTIAPPEITSQPKDLIVCLTDKPKFSVTVVATEACTYFWEVSTDNGEYTPLVNDNVYSGVNTATLNIENVEGLNGNLYRVKVKGAIETYSDPAKLEVILVSPIQNNIQGVNELVYGEKTTFSVTGSKYASSYEWQVSKDGGNTFQVIAVADNNYQGAKTNALTLVKPTVAMSGYLYRVRVADKCESVDSDAIELSVQKKELTVKAKNIIKIYDGLPFTEVEVGSYTGFEYNEDETVLNGTLAYQGEEAINASDDPYDIVIDGLDADNYEIVYENGELTIEPAPLTITAENKSKIYGTANPAFTYTYDGLVNGETSIPDLSASTVADESSSVGDYPIVLSGSAINYSLTFVDGLLSITPKAVTITAENISRVYGEANPTLTLAYDGLVNGETSIAGISASTSADESSSVGDYDITVSGTSTNYIPTFVEGTLTITQKAVTVTAENKTKVYGETNPTLTLAYDGLVNGETSIPGLSVSTLANASSPVGDYDITVSGSTANYFLTFVKGTLTITQKAVTVTAENKTKVYGTANPTLTYTYDGLVNGETSIPGLSVSTLANASSPVGDYDITVSGSTANYSLTFIKGTLTITKKAVTVTAENKTKVYGEANPALTLTYDGLVNGESSIVGISASTAADESSSVGDYDITVSGTSTNYSPTFVKGTLTITRKAVTVTAENKTKVYGEANPILTLAYDGLVNGETSIAGISASTAADESSSVGDYDITVSGTSTNYIPTFVKGTLTITRKAVTVTAENKTKVYWEANPVLTLAYDGLVNGETAIPGLSVSTLANASSPVGDYDITVSGSTANYFLTFVKGTLTITQKAVTVTAENKTKVYGTANPTLTYTYDGLVNGETSIPGLSVSTLANASSPVGDYDITVSGSTANYSLTFIKGTLTITKKAVTVTAENKTKVYGEVNPALTLLYDGLVNGETSIAGISASTAADESSSVGDYDITVSGTSTNYSPTFVKGTLTITKKAVTVTAENKTKVYGEANPILTLAYDGLVNGETSIPGLSVSTLANTSSPVGDYPIKISGSSRNYATTIFDGNLKITPKPITITANDQSKLYNERDPELSYTIHPQLIGNDRLLGELDREPGENEGVYRIRQNTLKADANYQLSFISGVFTIEKKELSEITFRPRTVIYDGREHSLSVDNLPNGAKVTYENNGQTHAGVYTITATVTLQNFQDLILKEVLTINKANTIIDADEIQNHVYDGTIKNVKASLKHNETKLEYSPQQGYTNAGTYEIMISAKETTNYLASTKRIKLIIQQRNWEGLVFKDKEFTYNGQPQSLIVENIPAESRVEYIGNGKIDAGTYQVTARIIDPNFKETVLSANLLINKAKQKITFDEIGTLARSIGQVPLNVSTNSGLPITIKSDDVFVASISGNSLLIHRLGTVKLTASQEGNENFEAALPVSITVHVVDEKFGPIAVHPALSPNGDGINDFLMIEGIKNFPENKVTILTPNGLQVFQINGYDNDTRVFKGIGNKTVATGLFSQGTYFYVIEYKADGRWEVKKGWFVLKY